MSRIAGEIVAALGNGRPIEEPAYCSLADAVRRLIATHRLPPGTRLPSQRELAEAGSLARTTVASAYNLLLGEALIEVRRGAGTWVVRGRS